MFKQTQLIYNQVKSQLLFYKIIYLNQGKEETDDDYQNKKKRKALEKRKISEAEYESVTALLMGVETVQILQKYGNIGRSEA